jgi:hypothetical protein
MALVGAAVGLIWLYRSLGGTAGIAHRGERDLAWHVLSGVFGLWAWVASAATWAVVRGRPARVPRGGPMVLGRLGSGSLFAWSGWKLPFTLYLAVARPADAALPKTSRSRRSCTVQRWGRAPRCCEHSFVRGWCHRTRSPALSRVPRSAG